LAATGSEIWQRVVVMEVFYQVRVSRGALGKKFLRIYFGALGGAQNVRAPP
jgi:hypothetical protein